MLVQDSGNVPTAFTDTDMTPRPRHPYPVKTVNNGASLSQRSNYARAAPPAHNQTPSPSGGPA